MDPVTAVGLAASILQIINTTAQTIQYLNDVLVDAIDECPKSNETRDTVLITLENLLGSPNTHLIRTSRHITGIETCFTDVVYLEIRASHADIRKYLETRIPKESRLARHISKNAVLQESIVSTIIDKAEGMFLMAQLRLQSLAKKNNKREIRLALNKLPGNLDTIYDEAMKRTHAQERDDVQLAKKILMWISCAIRPFTVLEIRHALVIEPDTRELDETVPDEDIVISVCAGLVTIDQETDDIRLVHYTTQEYLERLRGEYFLLEIA
ncbi:hypothetical protein OEA41_010807 [Lepraria neglecta]|uniref:GPI inositol-deacylase winged helix domain-containing protein n=1 Tax=Lepraria neglecta TaxID=209136 RepID=A0AAE0DFW2_9LECA|nr:hypothetical protein OEA41_010807 [Lepraria neglecta]